ncbi:hypothetical protein [Pseudalkalibacillus sp. SCS-8]|uniref:hypothetical protein n=1 Tax=Pseudalkalibacillus nanhaiensis TaxID=3115291 RepID=UPI0032DA99B2
MLKKKVRTLEYKQMDFNNPRNNHQKFFIRYMKFMHIFSFFTRGITQSVARGDHTYTLLFFFQREDYANGNFIEITNVEGNGKDSYIYYQIKKVEDCEKGILKIKNTRYVYGLIEYDQGVNMNGVYDLCDIREDN